MEALEKLAYAASQDHRLAAAISSIRSHYRTTTPVCRQTPLAEMAHALECAQRAQADSYFSHSDYDRRAAACANLYYAAHAWNVAVLHEYRGASAAETGEWAMEFDRALDNIRYCDEEARR